MIKRLVVFSVVLLVLYFTSYSSHQFYLESKQVVLPFSLQKVYFFHLGFTLLVCINIAFLANVNKFTDQLGFIYLVTIFLKLILFCITFYKSIFTEETLSLLARFSLIFPMIIFLSTEVGFLAKILNKKQ